MNRQPAYEIVSEGPDKIVIRDLGPWDQHLTVTNGAEEVVQELMSSKILHPGQRLFYYDSDGEYGELKVREGEFDGFANATE